MVTLSKSMDSMKIRIFIRKGRRRKKKHKYSNIKNLWKSLLSEFILYLIKNKFDFKILLLIIFVVIHSFI